jgi:hypothetical protein
MSTSKSPVERNGVASWSKGTHAEEVAIWASKHFPEELILFVAAVRKRDAGALDAASKRIRQVATRIDAYRRMKEREWRALEKKRNADQGTDSDASVNRV